MKATTKENLNAKQHFEVLNGLRGIAAITVVGFHFMEMISYDRSKNLIGHGFLAVDFFFCLSGFVIGYAYDGRIRELGIKSFFVARLIRLHPLVVLGSILGFLGFLINPFGSHLGFYSTGKILLVFITSIFLVPFPIMKERYFNLFSFNAPSWSLFWEYISTIFYALILYKINLKYLRILIVLPALAVCLVCFRMGTLKGGWSGPSFWDGGVRVSYSFLAGLLLYRSNWILKTKLSFVGLSFLLGLALIVPYSNWNWLLEPIVVLFYFPMLIALGAGAKLVFRFKNICTFLGRISYPLYMTHYAAIWIFANYINSHKIRFIYLYPIIMFCVIFLVGIAYLLSAAYDIPIRFYLTKKRKNNLHGNQYVVTKHTIDEKPNK